MAKGSAVNALVIELTISSREIKEAAEEALDEFLPDFGDKKILKEMGYTETSIIASLANDSQFRDEIKKIVLREIENLSLGGEIYPGDVELLGTMIESNNDCLMARGSSVRIKEEEAQADQEAINRLLAKGYSVSKKK